MEEFVTPLFFVIFIAITIAIYFAPTIVAVVRGHKNTAAIVVVNTFLGFTMVGWVVALAWSLLHQDKADHRKDDDPKDKES